MTFVLADLGPSIVAAIPSFLAIVFVVACAVAFRSELRGWLGSATKLKLWGVEIERAAADLKEASPVSTPTDAMARRAVERLTEAAPRLAGMSILWVDDHPENNKQLRVLIAEYGPLFVLASSNPAARAELKRADYALVITDIARDAESETGLQLADEIVNGTGSVPVVVFTGSVSAATVSPKLRGITADAAELVHLIVDVAERR